MSEVRCVLVRFELSETGSGRSCCGITTARQAPNAENHILRGTQRRLLVKLQGRFLMSDEHTMTQEPPTYSTMFVAVPRFLTASRCDPQSFDLPMSHCILRSLLGVYLLVYPGLSSADWPEA